MLNWLEYLHLNLYFLLSENTNKEISVAQVTAYEIKCNLTVQLLHNQWEHFVHYLSNLHKMYLFGIFQKDVIGILKSWVVFFVKLLSDWSYRDRYLTVISLSMTILPMSVYLSKLAVPKEQICRVKRFVLRPRCPYCVFSKGFDRRGLAWFCGRRTH